MGTTTIKHKELFITIETIRTEHGWRWKYQIEVSPIRESDDSASTEEIAARDAIRRARHEIDTQWR